MDTLNRSISGQKTRPIQVLQFGEGNFLRGFVDYMIDIANEQEVFNGHIAIVKSIESGNLENFHKQEFQYTVILNGLVDGKAQTLKRQITCIADVVDAYAEYEKYMDYSKLDTLHYIVSNTTEAGIVFDPTDEYHLTPPKSFPGKLTKFLYERYKTFDGSLDKGLVMLPVELIDDNGIQLKKCVLQFCELWQLETGFVNWIQEACVFCSTLVDRIITGYPKDNETLFWDQLGYRDELIVTGEPFALWVIECPKDISSQFPLNKAGLPVIFTNDQKPYKQRKVRILNGAHTSFVLASYLAGNDSVLESINDTVIYKFMHDTIFKEVIPTLSLPKEELISFAESVITRFSNPYIKHALLSISLNSISKWKARCLPSFLRYIELMNEIPKHLAFSFAAMMAFYTGDELRGHSLIGIRNGAEYSISDDMPVLEFFRLNCRKDSKSFSQAVLSNVNFWDQDLTAIDGILDSVAEYLEDIRTLGMRNALEKNFHN
jgi:tagaturonate reductase